MKEKVSMKRGLKITHYLIAHVLFVLSFTLLFGVLPSWAGIDIDKESIKPKLAKINMPFIENQGQVKDSSVKFYAHTFAGNVFVNDKGEILYSLRSKDSGQKTKISSEKKQSQKPRFFADAQNDKNEKMKVWVIKERVQGFKGSGVRGLDKAETKMNHFIGNKKENWKNNIPSYTSISLGEIYEGIELKLKAYGNNTEKLFVVNPGADVSKIAMSLEGAKALNVNGSGELEMETGLGALKFTKPYAYQEIDGKKTEVAANFVLHSHSKPETENMTPTYGFHVASYNKDYPLIIDPLLASTFIGGSDDDIGYSITTDLQGNVYITGATLSVDYPATIGAYDPTYNGGWDVFVSKFNNSLATLLASTFIGGTHDDEGFSIAINMMSDYVYVTGRTKSVDYPATPGAYDTTYNGGWDVFVSKLDINLANLLASTYIGGNIDGSTAPGSGDEGGHDIALEFSGVIYVTGWTDSLDYPTTPGAYDITYNGGISDVFVSKLDDNLSSLLSSTYIGGTEDDGAYSISLSPASGEGIYVTGWTNSADYPVTPGAYDTTYNGGWDVLVSNLNINLSFLMASTYIGGANDEGGNSIAIRAGGMNVFVTGQTNSPNYPVTPGAYDTTCGTDGNCNFDGTNYYNDVLVSRLDISLSNTPSNYIGTFIGGSNDDMGFSLSRDSWRRLAVVACGDDIYLTGRTASADYPTTPVSAASPGTYDQTYNGGWDVLVSSLNNNLANLLASTYIGGGNDEGGYSIATDSSNLFVTGQTNSPSYPTTPGAYDTTYNGGEDVFVSKFTCTDVSYAVTFSASVTPNSLTINVTASVDCGGTCPSLTYDWDWGDTTTTTGLTTNTSSHSYSTGGTKTINLTVKRASDGLSVGSVTRSVTILNPDLPPVAAGTCTWTPETWTMSVLDASTDDGPDGDTLPGDGDSSLQIVVDWGDGSLRTIGAQGGTFIRTYSKVGTFPVTLRANDTKLQTNTTTCSVNATPAYFTISGTVYRSNGTTAVTYATVQLYKGTVLQKSVSTAATGTFSFGSLKPGTYSLKVLKSGYTFANPAWGPTAIGPNATGIIINAIAP